MKNLVVCKVVIHLVIHNLFKNLAERRKNRHRSVVLGFQTAELLVQWDHLSVLPVAGELALHDGHSDDVVQGLCNVLSRQLY